ncbi:MAG: hypothetical protein SV487_04935 [Thermodesulfobacteriota bacterium]|nr:hypothetical protein [Thermodesulfobacteriota bacterium]
MNEQRPLPSQDDVTIVPCESACPMCALKVGPLSVLRARHGEAVEAEGFQYLERFRPSVTLKPKLRDQADFKRPAGFKG